MIRFTALAAAVACAAALSSVAAKAELYYGPLQNGNMCWNKRMDNGHANGGFGYWSECPKAASVTVRRVRRSHQ
jgi:Spy/CpxP family protein refolding chaperone